MSQTLSSLISDNTVPAAMQLTGSEYVIIDQCEKVDLKVLFAGCSITRHAPKADIGWLHDWGMAASAREKDYVHLLTNHIRSFIPNVSVCIAQTAYWERNFDKDSAILDKYYREAAEFGANIIVINGTGNNISSDNPEMYRFREYYERLIDFFNTSGKAEVILVMTSFYESSMNEMIRETAAARKYQLADITYLGRLDEMKAGKRFTHKGVASHPGDKGMKAIADVAWKCLSDSISCLVSAPISPEKNGADVSAGIPAE